MINIALFLIFLLLCAFFAGSETGFYRMSRFQLRLGIEQKRPFYRQLAKSVENGQEFILAMLIGNTLAGYLLTSVVIWTLLKKIDDGHRAEFLSTIITTPLVFLVGEIIPKTLFFYHANYLMARAAPVLYILWKVFTFTRAVRALRWVFGIFSRLLRLPIDTAAAVDITKRDQVRQIIHETQEEGLVSVIQKDIMQRLINIPEISISSILIPHSKVDAVEAGSGREHLLNMIRRCSHRRILVYENDRNNILGFIDIYQALCNSKQQINLRAFVQPVLRLHASVSILDAISIMRKNSHRLAVIIADKTGALSEADKVLGILTLKDLMEELTGELAGL